MSHRNILSLLLLCFCSIHLTQLTLASSSQIKFNKRTSYPDQIIQHFLSDEQKAEWMHTVPLYSHIMKTKFKKSLFGKISTSPSKELNEMILELYNIAHLLCIEGQLPYAGSIPSKIYKTLSDDDLMQICHSVLKYIDKETVSLFIEKLNIYIETLEPLERQLQNLDSLSLEDYETMMSEIFIQAMKNTDKIFQTSSTHYYASTIRPSQIKTKK